MAAPRIPEYITVHLGNPNDSSAQNVRVPFIDYVKNVASSEIYPTWPESSLRANMFAQISFALNRIYTEWYPSRGYDFDITSDTQYDQKFIYGRDIFDSVSTIADEIFNDYVVREGNISPLFAQYCDGVRTRCPGLSQWGTVDLAEEGLTPYEILQYYYGDDIGIVYNAPTAANLPSYPGRALSLGTAGEDVRTIQRQLNRIGQNYPAIRPYLEADGLFDTETEEAVKAFQRIFNLTPDGIVGKATWYKIKSIFNAVKGLAELTGEGISYSEADRIYTTAVGPGDTGTPTEVVQYYLSVISFFDASLPQVYITGTYDQNTENAVRQFQAANGLNPDGIVGRETWNALTDAYERTIATLPPEYTDRASEIYPGRFLDLGQSGRDVLDLQILINRAAANYPYIPTVAEDGEFGPATERAVIAIQENGGLPVSGVAGPLTWYTLNELTNTD
ncbi:MAG: spore cortex-lytic protein [Ruminococcaceae bacterium]|nr:spore cortex-lytic protein [Oscillospiraceae bacterium]